MALMLVATAGIMASQWDSLHAVSHSRLLVFAFERLGDGSWGVETAPCRRISLEPGTGAEGRTFNEGLDLLSRSYLHHLA